jgi:hypothetical protein
MSELIVYKNQGGRPSKITEDMFWEMMRIKNQYGIQQWKQLLKLTKELYPNWRLPTYNNFLIQIQSQFTRLIWVVNLILAINREITLKKIS